MRRLVLTACVVLTACAAHMPAWVQPFRAPLLGGGELDFGSIAGHRPVVLILWATWCRSCIDEAPLLIRAYERYAPQVAFVAVSVDEPSEHGTLRELVARLQLPYPIALDPEGTNVMARYTDRIPLVLVIDASGGIRHRLRAIRGDQLERAIAGVLP